MFLARWRTYILHDANSLLGLADEFVLGLLDLGTSLLAQVVITVAGLALLAGQCESTALSIGLGGIQTQPRVLDLLASTCRELDVGVEGCAPASQESALDLGVLRQTGLANLLAGDGVLLKGSGQGVLARVGLLGGEHVRAVQGGAGNSMAEGLGLGLRAGWCGKCCLGLCGRCGARQEVDLLGDGAAEVVERLAEVRRVVVGFVGVLRRDLEHSRVHLSQRIDALLELDVVGRKLGLSQGPSAHAQLIPAIKRGARSTKAAADLVAREAHLVLSLTKLLFDILLGPGSKRREGGTRDTVSACLLCAAQQQNMGSHSSYVPEALSECRNLAEVVHGDVCVRNGS